MKVDLAYDCLAKQGIKPSLQRLAVMDYLLQHPTHPTADEIHAALVRKMPTLSKTTVYNTLRLLVEQGAAAVLTIDGRNANFDAETRPHAHFLCRRCNRIYDLPAAPAGLLACTEVPEGFGVDETALYLKGTCKACSAAPGAPGNLQRT